MLDNLKTSEDIQDEVDSLGSFILDTDAYDFVIDMVYLDTAKSGAIASNWVFKTAEGRMLRQQLWMTSGQAKGCLNYYVDKNDKKQYLPGFLQANGICELSIGKELSALSPEEKTVNVYDFELRKDVPMPKQVLTELLGQKITLGVIRQVVDKNIKNDAGEYVASGDTREENIIDKVFRTSDGLTMAEIKAGATSPDFKQKWVDKNKGTIRQRAKGAQANGAKPAETASLFGGQKK